MNDATRLERLEDVIVRLREAAAGNALIVEGPRDRAALDALGIGGVHIQVNQGRGQIDVIDRIAAEAQRLGWAHVILLLDWDRTGHVLFDRIRHGLAGRVPIDEGFRKRLRRLSHTSSLEEVPADLAALRRRCAVYRP